jgi:hypothetical protein
MIMSCGLTTEGNCGKALSAVVIARRSQLNGLIERALVTAEAAGCVLRLDDMGDVGEISREVVALASSALAPLAANALAAAVATAPDRWNATTSAFAARLGEQGSQLALVDTLDALLGAPAAAHAAATALHGALLANLDEVARERPFLAAARLEGALRVALTGTVTPYLVLHHLANIAASLPEEYLGAMPRLVGIALDRWETDTSLTEPLAAMLRSLRAVDAAAASAAHELACQRMRIALREPEPTAAVGGFAAAAEEFAEAAQLDEARDDAVAYAAVCSAVAAFGLGDAHRVELATVALDDVMRQRAAWHHRMHQPVWRQPLLDAEVEWLGLVIDLRNAANRLAERSWLESAAAVGQLARAYVAERSTIPAPGLTAVVRPAIENAVTENAVLLDQLTRAIVSDRDRDQRVLPAGADLLLDAIRERRAKGRPRTGAVEDGADEEGDPAVDARIDRLAPRLRLLGADIARDVANRADDGQLADIGVIVAATTASGVIEHPALGAMRATIVGHLSANPSFEGETKAVVTALLDTTLTFLLDRYDRRGPVCPGHTDIYRVLRRDEKPPLEKELQSEFYIWVANSHQFAGRARMEVSDIAGGRVDVIVRMGDINLVTEVKREVIDASRPSVEQKYIPQAASYSGSNVPFSQLLVLDLTDHTSGIPPLPDLAWVVEHRAQAGASPQHVVATVVVGNRPSPSTLKSRKYTAQQV